MEAFGGLVVVALLVWLGCRLLGVPIRRIASGALGCLVLIGVVLIVLAAIAATI